MGRGLRLTRTLVRSLGYDVVRFPRESHRDHLQAVFSKFEIDSVLDVGAHRGAFGHLVREAGYAGFIASFEPVEESFAFLDAASTGDPLWEVHRLALGREAGTASLNVSRDSRFSSFRPGSAYAGEFFPESVADDRREVQLARLDAIFEQVVPLPEPRAFLKLDTQGWDFEVLEGATGCLDAVLAMQVEVAVKPLYEGVTTYLDALPRLKDLGFELSGIFPVVRDSALRIVELDCVLVRS
jgi:FkbM family methyltransferase